MVRRARAEGPQVVTTRGAKPVVVLSAEDYAALVERRPLTIDDLFLPGEPLEPDRLAGEALFRPVEF